MSSGTDKAEFSERIYLKFKTTGKNTGSDQIIAELIEELELKKAMGIHHQWIKQAIFDQFKRERSAAVVSPEMVSSSSGRSTESGDSREPKNDVTTGEPIRDASSERVRAEDSGSRKRIDLQEGKPNAEVRRPKPAPLSKGMASIMG